MLQTNNNNQDLQGYLIQDYRPSTLSDHGVYYFCNEFSPNTTKDVITWILDNNFQTTNRFESLTLMITSYGGDLFSAFALIDVMRGSKIPIHTIGLGMIASAGLMTFIAGEPGSRIITPNTSILSHQWSAGTFGKEHELVASQKQFDLTTKRMIAHYKKCTKLSEKMIREKLLPPQDVWLSADEAKEYNLVDQVKMLR
jgi:ATP-dependent Clp protease protease subunit